MSGPYLERDPVAEMLLINPRKRRKAKKARSARKSRRRALFGAAAAPAKKRRRRGRKLRTFRVRAKRNPILSGGFVADQLKPAAIGAAGAIVNDVIVGALAKKLPASLQTGMVKHATKAAIAVAAGMVAQKAGVGRAVARQATVGALTCVLYGIGRDALKKAAPSVQLGTMGEQLSAVVGDDDSELFNYTMGEQLSGGYDSDALAYADALNGMGGAMLPDQYDAVSGDLLQF